MNKYTLLAAAFFCLTTPSAFASPDFCEGKAHNQVYANPESCQYYIWCDFSGIPTIEYCPNGLHFDRSATSIPPKRPDRAYAHCVYPDELVPPCDEATGSRSPTPPTK